MNEKDLDQLLSLEEEWNEQEEVSLAKKMKKKLEKQMNKRVFLGIILTVAVTGILLFLISCSFDLLFYNPKKPSRYIEDTDLDDYVYSDFHFLMDIYTGLTYPGKRYYQVEHLSKSEGFGSYKMYAKIQDAYEPMNIDGRYNTVYQIKRNRFSVEPMTEESITSVHLWDFYNDSKADEHNTYIKDHQDMDAERMEEIEKLPESAVLYATVSFDKARSLEDTIAFIRQYPNSDFNWIAMDSDVQFMVGSFDGIRLDAVITYPLTEEAEEKYPYLTLYDLSEETTAEQLEQCYLSRLQILRDNPIFLRVVSYEQGYYDDARRKTSQIDDRLAEIEEKGLWSIGLYGRITKEDFLTMVEKGEIPYAVIKDAKLSVLSK